MRMILICSLAMCLVGCSCVAPQLAMTGACGDPKRFDCFGNFAPAPRIASKPAAAKINPPAKPSNVAGGKRIAGPRSRPEPTASKAISIKGKARAVATARAPARHLERKTITRKAGAERRRNDAKAAAKAAGQHGGRGGTTSKTDGAHKKKQAALSAKVRASQVAARRAAPRSRPDPVKAVFALGAATQSAPPVAAAVSSDPVMDKAKAAILARMEDPEATVFVQMKRANRKNMLGQPIDTICGRVRGKPMASSEAIEMPFLYIVAGDDVYTVDGDSDIMAKFAYNNICK